MNIIFDANVPFSLLCVYTYFHYYSNDFYLLSKREQLPATWIYSKVPKLAVLASKCTEEGQHTNDCIKTASQTMMSC